MPTEFCLANTMDPDSDFSNLRSGQRKGMKKLKTVPALLVTTLLIGGNCYAAHRHLEKYYQDKWCAAHDGKTEVVLPDKARVDCVTSSNAIEFDFGKKWAESIGQALYYSAVTGKKAGIVLIMENPEKDQVYRTRLMVAIKGLPVDVWEIEGQ